MKKLPLLMLCIALSGCIKKNADKLSNIHGVKWSGTYAVPLVNADMSIDDAVGIVHSLSGVSSYTDGLVYLPYSTTLVSKMGYELVPLPDQNNIYTDKLTAGEITTLTGTSLSTASRDFTFTYNSPGQEIDSLTYGSAKLKITVNNNYQHDGDLAISFPDLKLKSGVVANLSFHFPSGVASANATIDLNNFIWDMTKGGSGFNHIRVHADVTYHYTGAAVLGTDNFTITTDITQQKFSKVYGYFGNNNLITHSDSLELGIFGNAVKKGTYNFSDPRFKIKVTNTTGIPLSLHTNSLSGLVKGGSLQAITGYPSTKNISEVSFGQEGKSVIDSFLLIKTNSNIKAITDVHSNYIVYNLNVESNPGGKIKRNFVLPESKVSVLVSMELPFSGTAVGVEMTDTSSFSLGLGDAKKYIDWIVLRFHIENGLPLNVGIQGYFMDSNNVILDSLFTPFHYFAGGAPIDGSGNITSTFMDQYDITYDRPRIEHLDKSKRLLIRAMMATSLSSGTSIPVKITLDQHIKIKLGIHAKLSVNEKI